jgi:hypothetical protein
MGIRQSASGVRSHDSVSTSGTLEVPRPRWRKEDGAVHLLVDNTGLKLYEGVAQMPKV